MKQARILSIKRESIGLFWKMFIGMYLTFFISYICFYIHSDRMDSRFGISVDSLFAIVGNKYIIDSALPDSASFTLVDTLHVLTLLFILFVIAANAYSLRLIKQNQSPLSKERINKCSRFNGIFFLYTIPYQTNLCL